MPDIPIPVGKHPAKTTAPTRMTRPGFDLWQGVHDEVDRMFDRFSRGFGFPSMRRLFDASGFGVEPSFTLPTPAVDVSEDDNAYRITVELPGISEKDLDVSLSDDVITIKGEKREDKEQKQKDYHLIERRYGSFQRSFGLPASVDREKIAASVDKGVLTLTLPKTADALKQQKKIEIKTS
jgi:HSP20 family protein